MNIAAQDFRQDVQIANAIPVTTVELLGKWTSSLGSTLLKKEANLNQNLYDMLEVRLQNYNIYATWKGAKKNRMFTLQCRHCYDAAFGWWSLDDDDGSECPIGMKNRPKEAILALQNFVKKYVEDLAIVPPNVQLNGESMQA